MDRFQTAVVDALFKLESHGYYSQAKELLLSFLEIRKEVNNLPQYIVSFEGNKMHGKFSVQD